MNGNKPILLGKEFDEAIEFVRKSSIGTPKKIDVDLSVATANLEMNIAGNFFYIKEASDNAVYLNVRFNELREPSFRMRKMQGFYTPFYKFILDFPAQAGGTIEIVYGTLAKDFIDVIDNRSAAADEMSEVVNELAGDLVAENVGSRVGVNAAATLLLAANADRKSCIIQHDPVTPGVGFICLGFTNAVTVAQFFAALAPGDVFTIDDYRGAIYGIRTGAATNAQVGEV